MDIIQRPGFYLKDNVSENAFCLRLQVEPTQLGAIDRVILCLQNQQHLKTEIESCLRRVLYKEDRTMDNVQNCDSYINIPSSQTYR
jgi:hypothetical protein